MPKGMQNNKRDATKYLWNTIMKNDDIHDVQGKELTHATRQVEERKQKCKESPVNE